jgi:hypothetical protein
MFNRLRRTTVAAACALTLAAAGTAWAAESAAASSAAPAAAPACSSSSLSVWVDASQSDAGAGTFAFPLEFTNISGKACTLFGYPGVSAINGSGKQLGNAASRDSLFAAKTVTIPAGGTAHADLFYSNGEVTTAPGCKPVTATLIKVYPPNQKAAKNGFFDLRVCSAANHPYLKTSVVRPGPRLDV